ncbi:hypothetical protein HHK36_019725 [Tetracentron sinense]|uniref:Uncharacterized protein n=1 Tax=Tetracentron sinense TaxID=13715 RepID=A0A834YUA4_TETSI|nr:hypothetical protein HHK36_019725 [Tetracentron sinense]
MGDCRSYQGDVPRTPRISQNRKPPHVKQPSSYEGEPALLFSSEELSRSASPFRSALIVECINGRPSISALKEHIQKHLHAKMAFSIGILDAWHFLLRFESESDFLAVWLKNSKSCDYRPNMEARFDSKEEIKGNNTPGFMDDVEIEGTRVSINRMGHQNVEEEFHPLIDNHQASLPLEPSVLLLPSGLIKAIQENEISGSTVERVEHDSDSQDHSPHLDANMPSLQNPSKAISEEAEVAKMEMVADDAVVDLSENGSLHTIIEVTDVIKAAQRQVSVKDSRIPLSTIGGEDALFEDGPQSARNFASTNALFRREACALPVGPKWSPDCSASALSPIVGGLDRNDGQLDVEEIVACFLDLGVPNSFEVQIGKRARSGLSNQEVSVEKTTIYLNYEEQGMVNSIESKDGDNDHQLRDLSFIINNLRTRKSLGFLQSAVPSWEKQFCYSVGSIPWKKLLETKKAMSYHENVVQWNDSAGEEAFHNAKNRFWAAINGLPCGISLPDPDIYIDEIDWNSNINPELLLDLDKKPVLLNEERNGEVEFLVDHYSNQPVVPTGWGDADEDPIRKTNKSLSGPNLGDYDRNLDNGDYPCKLSYSRSNEAVEGKAWGGREDDINKSENWEFRRTGRDWGTQNGNSMKTEGFGLDMSRYKIMRFQGGYKPTIRQTTGRWMEEEGKGWIFVTIHSNVQEISGGGKIRFL